MKKIKTILVTGCNGFIGKTLVHELLKDNRSVIGVDYKVDPNEINRPEYTFIYADLSTDILAQKIKQVDLCIHLASPIGVNAVKDQPSNTFHTALKINTNVLTYCKLFNVPLIFASSSEVYGSGDIESKLETYKIPSAGNSDRGSYALQKILMEYEMKFSNLPSTVVKFFNVIGPDQDTQGMILPTFIDQALSNQNLTIKENGLRSYCDVKDMSFQMMLIVNEFEKDNKGFDVINIGNPSIDNKKYASEIAELVLERVKIVQSTTSELQFVENTQEEIPRRFFSERNKYNEHIQSYSIKHTIDSIICNRIDSIKQKKGYNGN